MNDRTKKIGVLLGQIGTPDAPTPQALRPYLKNFLSDPRVIDYHPLLWKTILYGIILRVRPTRSAKLYKEIWTPEGSPLLKYSRAQVEGIQKRLGDNYVVRLGMAYGGPTMKDAVASLEAEGIQHIVVLPLFPQFSTITTASVFDETYSALSGRSWNTWRIRKKNIPATRFVGPYFNHPDYIAALSHRIHRTVEGLPHKPDKFIIAFHGIPKRYVEEGDPYLQHCQTTAHLLALAMKWKDEEWIMTFQSRFGREEWLGPYTDATIEALASQGIQRPCVITPAFVTDCLETLHELGIEGKKSFAKGGGDTSQYAVVPCLNDDSEWLDVVSHLVRTNTEGWLL